ncbi:MAG: ribonuclease III [Cyclobacteriaceae bacterium]|nr:ribonuclease III [Cyclobacteriaceae bacterium]
MLGISKSDRERNNKIRIGILNIVGKRPRNLNIFKIALIHSSSATVDENGFRDSNERLEYLGDAILGAIVADYLFKKYPRKSEGFLTEIRSRIVKRESLNQIGRKLGLGELIEFDFGANSKRNQSVYGNALEAIIGAVYIDRGFDFCKKFVINKLIDPNFSVEELEKNDSNYKSRLIEWAQKENKDIHFKLLKTKDNKKFKEFTAQVIIENESFGTGHGLSKKKAEQNAAEKTLELLNL